MALSMVWPGGHGMIFGIDWEGLAWYGMVCANAYVNLLPSAMVPFTCGEAYVSWLSCSNVCYMHVLFTSTAPVHSGQGQ